MNVKIPGFYELVEMGYPRTIQHKTQGAGQLWKARRNKDGELEILYKFLWTQKVGSVSSLRELKELKEIGEITYY